MIEYIKKILYPKSYTCSACRREKFNDGYFCKECYDKIKFNDGYICDKCGRRTVFPVNLCDVCKGKMQAIDLCRSICAYEEPMRGLIKMYKYEGYKYLSEPFADWLYKKAIKEIPFFDVITFVPMVKKKEKKRGYNQSGLLASKLAKRMNVELIDLLIKVKDTESQVGLNERQRLENLKGSFKVKDKSKVSGKKVLVVDDTVTTGATLETVARVLKEAKAECVYAITVCFVDFKSKKV